MNLKPLALAMFAAGILAAAPGQAAAPVVRTPQPAAPVAVTLYSGRWYEIARIPNSLQRDCEGATSDFLNFTAGRFRVVQTCHKGAPTGPQQVQRAQGTILPASNNAKLKMAFFGGVVTQEYWILDRANDGSWAIMATPGRNYLWLLSRRPVLDPAVRAQIVRRIGGFGYDVRRLQFPRQRAA